MSTQQDIYAAGSEIRPPMLHKENYVPWSSRLLCYAKSRPNGKLIHNSIINGPYVRRMIPEPEGDDQAIQTILLGLFEDIYVDVNSCKTAQEIWLRVQQMMKGSDIGIQEKKAKLFNKWERFTSNEGESIESYYHCFLKLMNDLKQNKHFSEKIASNLKFLNNLQPEWSRHVTIVHQTKDLHTADYTQLYDFLKYNQKKVDELKAKRLVKIQDPLALIANSNNPYAFLAPHQDQPSFNQNYIQQPMPNLEDITDPTTAINMALALMAKAFKLNYSTPTNNNQRISSNLCNRQIAQPGMNMGQDRQMQMVRGNGKNQFRQYAWQNVGNLNGYNAVQNVRNQVAQNPRVQNVGNHNGLIGVQGNANLNGNADLDEIEEFNANCILMANLQQASISGTQFDKGPVYDSDGSAEVHDYKNCNDNEIFNMFTQEEQYNELLEPILKPHQVPQNDHNVTSEVTSVEQSGETVEQHIENFEETRALYDSLYQNLAIKVEKVNSVNRKLKETNADLTTELSVYQEQCLSKNINALHLSFGKQIMTLNEEISNLNKQLSKEKSTVSFLLEEKKKLKSDFKTRKDEHLDKQIQLEKKIKELNNILVKIGQSIQTIHMLSPKPDSFYHTEQKMALGYQNPFYLKQAQKKQQSLYDGKVLLEKHDPPVVHDSEETLQLAQECHQNMKQLNKEIKPSNYTKINHLSRVFVSQTAKSREELYFSNDSKTANVSKSISIPNEEFSDDTTPSVARKLLNRVQNFEIQFLKEAAKFVGDFKSLAKEADDSLAKHKELELEIERLLRAVVSQDIMSVMQKISVVDTLNLQTELERVSDILNTLSRKLENENVELEFQVLNYAKENGHLKATYKNLFNSISVSRTQTKTIISSLQNQLHNLIYENAKLRTQLFNKVSDQKDNKSGTSANTKFAKQSIVENLPKVGETHALSKPVTSNSIPTPHESKVVKNDKVITPGMFRITPFKNSREEKHVPNTVRASARTKLITVSQPSVITKKDVNSDSNGIVRFENDHVAAILGQFCDSDLEVVFRRNACVVRNLDGVDLLKGDHLINLYTINLHEMSFASPICLMARASSTKSWLWHQCLSHLNFDTINDIARNDLVFGLPKFKYHKEHICPSCEQGKSKRASYPPKPVPNSRQRLHLLYMNLCGPMRISSINGKRYVLVIVDDYSHYTWVHFLRSKDETLEVIKTFLKRITVLLQSPVIIIRTDNDTKFKNQVLTEYFDCVGISHQMSSVRTHQQNEVVERKNWTLVEAARTMLIFFVHRCFYGLKQLLLHVLLKTAPLFTVDLTKHHTSSLTAENRISPSFMYSGLFVIPRMTVKTLG
nr:hypothetical protein [Tanacetum cinerariifolium]